MEREYSREGGEGGYWKNRSEAIPQKSRACSSTARANLDMPLAVRYQTKPLLQHKSKEYKLSVRTITMYTIHLTSPHVVCGSYIVLTRSSGLGYELGILLLYYWWGRDIKLDKASTRKPAIIRCWQSSQFVNTRSSGYQAWSLMDIQSMIKSFWASSTRLRHSHDVGESQTMEIAFQGAVLPSTLVYTYSRAATWLGDQVA
jgi:hypothetical protein